MRNRHIVNTMIAFLGIGFTAASCWQFAYGQHANERAGRVTQVPQPPSRFIQDVLHGEYVSNAPGDAMQQITQASSNLSESSRYQQPHFLPLNHQPGYRTTRQAVVVWQTRQEPIPKEELDRQQRIADLQQQLTTAADDDERDKVAEELGTAYSDLFDEDLAKREKEIAEVEARIAKLRAQLDERKKMRDTIIAHRLDSVLLQSKGLAFPDSAPAVYPTASPDYYTPDSFRPASPVSPNGPSGYSQPLPSYMPPAESTGTYGSSATSPQPSSDSITK
ncbi:MAG: hypothetical protein R3C28_04895 [Pirellulaceae bacterium]